MAQPWADEIGTTINPACCYVGEVYSDSPDLSHLPDGQLVAILANGEVLDEQTVSSGTVTIPSGYDKVHIGLPYYADLETLNIKLPFKDAQSIQGMKMKVGSATFHLQDTRGGWLGPNENDLWEAFTQDAFRQHSGNNIGDTEMFTGKIRQPLVSGYDGSGRVFVRQVDPLPITIGAIMPEVDIGGYSR